MNKNEVIVRTLARGIMASTLTASFLAQSDTHTTAAVTALAPDTMSSTVAFLDEKSPGASYDGFVFTLAESPKEWTTSFEREFRRLAALEVKGALSVGESSRLEELNAMRDRLLCPQTTTEMLLQIRRDRLVSKMKELLNEYVKFDKASGNSGSSS